MKKILFLCTGNSCRSQMAEGWARQIWRDRAEVFSAGTKKHGLNPFAVAVMKEVGIDISDHFSKTLEELNQDFDLVVTVCDNARETCPLFPGKAKILHHSFDDPPYLAKELPEDKALEIYRRVRDEIKNFIEELNIDLEN